MSVCLAGDLVLLRFSESMLARGVPYIHTDFIDSAPAVQLEGADVQQLPRVQSGESQDSPVLMRRATAGSSGGARSVQRFAEPSSPARQIPKILSDAPQDSELDGVDAQQSPCVLLPVAQRVPPWKERCSKCPPWGTVPEYVSDEDETQLPSD